MTLSLAKSRALRLITFGALYFAQGLPFGLIAVGYLLLLSDAGRTNEDIGAAMSWAYIPWAFKLVWGPLLDRMPATRFGRRRPFVVLSELMMGATLLLLLFFDTKTQLDEILVVFVIHSTFAALQDEAVDALAVDVLHEDERGRANSIMWACKSAGTAVGGGGGAIFAKYFGWHALFVALAILIFAIMLLPLLCKEGNESGQAVDQAAPSRLDWKELKRSFWFSAPLFGIAIAFFTPFGYARANGVMVRVMRVVLKMS
ncbi:MAG: MFS transporter, partial [Polyangiaceae bacterium]|nr:MFS transporter [Polyangiaceae bacterium]